MKLTHAGEDKLSCLLIAMHFDCGILFHHFLQRLGHFFLIGLTLRFQSEGNERGEVYQAIVLDGGPLVAEGLPR